MGTCDGLISVRIHGAIFNMPFLWSGARFWEVSHTVIIPPYFPETYAFSVPDIYGSYNNGPVSARRPGGVFECLCCGAVGRFRSYHIHQSLVPIDSIGWKQA